MKLAAALLASVLAVAAGSFAYAQAENGANLTEPPQMRPELQSWSFAGPFGKFDRAQVQRGYQIYKEVCSNCHSMQYLTFRNLGDENGPGFTEDEVKALAASVQVQDGPDDTGAMFERPGKPYDHFPSPFANVEAAKAANGGAAPPDLSVMAKARGSARGVLWGIVDFFTQYQEGGPDYIHAILTGYADPPACVDANNPPSGYYNKYFPVGGVPEGCKNAEGVSTITGSFIAMPPPLADGVVTYSDGTPETVDQYARDVSAFLMWAAEPSLPDRKRMGFEVMVFLVVFAGLMYLTKKRVWANVAH